MNLFVEVALLHVTQCKTRREREMRRS